MKNENRLVGAHLSTAGGLKKTLERAKALGCSAVQIFVANPRGWQSTPISEEAADAYKQAAADYGVHQLIIHAIYLVNLASPKEAVFKKSLAALRKDLVSAGRLGVKGIVLHPGSDLGEGQGVPRLERALASLKPNIPAGCRILLEGMAGTKNSLGDIPTIGSLCNNLGDAFGVCLDSAHLCASGYNLGEPKDFQRFTRDVKKHIGFKKLGCFHLNDSRQPCGSRRDHHENLGDGFVGKTGLVNVLQYKAFAHLPFIMETPGFDALGPDKKNMQRLRRYLKAD